MTISCEFSGVIALITGSSSGIGAETARMFSRAGAHVVITGLEINSSDVSAVAEQCFNVSPNKLKALAVLLDLSKEEECKRLIETTIREFGKLDVLINCAAIVRPNHIIESNYLRNYKLIFDTNLNSIVYLTQHSIEHLEKTKGNIINISSIESMITQPYMSAYSITKSAIDMFTRNMATELGHKHIRVNSINPGMVKTNIAKNNKLEIDYDSVLNHLANQYPIGRVGEVKDIANTILFLANNQSTFITGTNFIVDGGHIVANVSFNI